MSSRMFKYLICPEDGEPIDVPMTEGTIIRALGMQRHQFFAWAETPSGGASLALGIPKRRFRVIGTGYEIPELGTYLGTLFDGPFVWHVYEVTAS